VLDQRIRCQFARRSVAAAAGARNDIGWPGAMGFVGVSRNSVGCPFPVWIEG